MSNQQTVVLSSSYTDNCNLQVQGWAIRIFGKVFKKFCCASRLRATGGVWRLEHRSSEVFSGILCPCHAYLACDPVIPRGHQVPCASGRLAVFVEDWLEHLIIALAVLTGAQELQILIHAFLTFGLEVK